MATAAVVRARRPVLAALDAVATARTQWRAYGADGLKIATAIVNEQTRQAYVEDAADATFAQGGRLDAGVREAQATAADVARLAKQLADVVDRLAVYAQRIQQQRSALEHLLAELVRDYGAPALQFQPVFATATLGDVVDALATLSRGYDEELAIKAAVAAALPSTDDRAVAVQYLLAWQEEPAVTDRDWGDVETLVRVEADWPAPTTGAVASPRRS